jgi:transposase
LKTYCIAELQEVEMPRQLKLLPYLSIDELETLYRQAKDRVERSHYQIIWLLSLGRTTQEVADVTGYSLNWIRTLVRRYNQRGIQGIKDGRHDNSGAEPLLNNAQEAQLWQILQSPAPDGGLWNGRKVAEWMSEVSGRKVDRHRGWEYWRQLRLRLRQPRLDCEGSSRPSGTGGLKKTSDRRTNNQ